MWFPKVDIPTNPYNLKPYTPKDKKRALLKKDQNSAPGVDGIVYEFLTKMSYLHQALATAFTKIRDSGEAPENWATSQTILIKKALDDSNDDPVNFRMIALTLNIGKLYHTLEAERSMQFMLENKYLDPQVQKAYVEGVNGCVEHVIVVQETIQHSRTTKNPLNITWFDTFLSNEAGK